MSCIPSPRDRDLVRPNRDRWPPALDSRPGGQVHLRCPSRCHAIRQRIGAAGVRSHNVTSDLGG
jgi:hypothetical protein